MKHIIRSSVVALSLAVSAVFIGTSGAGAAPAQQPATIQSVVVSGSMETPTVTVTGTGFKKNAPKSYDASQTLCGSYTGNGDWYGRKGLWIKDTTEDWQAGQGNASEKGNCIGLIVDSWSPTQVVFQFGSAYGEYSEWYLYEGDAFKVMLRKTTFSGTVSY